MVSPGTFPPNRSDCAVSVTALRHEGVQQRRRADAEPPRLRPVSAEDPPDLLEVVDGLGHAADPAAELQTNPAACVADYLRQDRGGLGRHARDPFAGRGLDEV